MSNRNAVFRYIVVLHWKLLNSVYVACYIYYGGYLNLFLTHHIDTHTDIIIDLSVIC